MTRALGRGTFLALMNARRLIWAAIAIAACSRELPSATPLGGILDDEGAGSSERERHSNKAAPADAGSELPAVAETEPEKKPEPEAKTAAESDAGAVDAGASDAAEPATAPQKAAWAGEYVGSDVTTTRISGMPERVQPDDKARTRVEESGSGRVVLHVIDSSNGSTLCSLRAQAQGTTASIDSGQECFGGAQMQAQVESGRAELQGDRLVFDVRVRLEIVMEDNELTGSMDYHFDGKRK